MSTNSDPTTDDVRASFVWVDGYPYEGHESAERGILFDGWLAKHDRDVRDTAMDEVIDRTDEIEGTVLEGVVDRPWIHTRSQVKQWLMGLRNEFFIADDSTTLDDPGFDAHTPANALIPDERTKK